MSHHFLRSRRDIASLLLRTALFFFAANVAFAAADPMPQLARLSLYNSVFPGRDRLPFQGREGVFSPTVYELDAMFASHRIAVPPAADEFRVVLVGDSTVRGVRLATADTYAGRLNAARLRAPDGRRMRFYNLGNVGQRLLRDALMIEKSLQFKPDLILWFVSIQSFNDELLLNHDLVSSNLPTIARFADRHALHIDGLTWARETWFDRTIIGRRVRLKQLFALQIHGIMWSISRVETNPNAPPPPQPDLRKGPLRWAGHLPPHLPDRALRFDVMNAVLAEAGRVPIIIINEPIRIDSNPDYKDWYNQAYPRWAYDEYRRRLTHFAAEHSALLVDLWDQVPNNELADLVHPRASGARRVGERIAQELIERMNATREL